MSKMDYQNKVEPHSTQAEQIFEAHINPLGSAIVSAIRAHFFLINAKETLV